MTHVWGVSKAADRVWGQVSGLGSRSGTRVFIVLQAFIDESIEDGLMVIGGVIATAEAWTAFSKEWERLLDSGWGTTREDGRRHFKMSEMAAGAQRLERVEVFFRVIEQHTIAFLSAKVSARDVKLAASRILLDGRPVTWPPMAVNSYYTAFRVLMDSVHQLREPMAKVAPFIPSKDKIDFYFDNRTEKRAILEGWDSYLQFRPPKIREYYGATPRFEDDADFLPLQAADFWAWWVRKWHIDGRKQMDFGTFGLKAQKEILVVDLVTSEANISSALKQSLRLAYPGGVISDMNMPNA